MMSIVIPLEPYTKKQHGIQWHVKYQQQEAVRQSSWACEVSDEWLQSIYFHIPKGVGIQVMA